MPSEIDDTALNLLLARAGLSATPEQRAGLKLQYPRVVAMAASVRTPRSPIAELAHSFRFNQEDLG